MSDETGLHLSAPELAEILASDDAPLLIDVRERYEFESGHIPGAKNVPLGEIAPLFDDPANAAPMIFICHSGVRSLEAANVGRIAGLDDTRSVDGGMIAWQALEL